MTPPYVVIVTGPRGWEDEAAVWRELDLLLAEHGQLVVKHGACGRGVDKHVAHWCLRHRDTVKEDRWYADWDIHGAAAGPIRNRSMVASRCQRPGPHLSHGASRCAHLARAAGIPVRTDVDALVERGRLMNFTHTWSRETRWQKIDPPVTPTPADVNEWSVIGMGHDSINAMIAIEARAKRDGFDPICSTCGGHASLEAYSGQREEAEAWESTGPPEGEGWQLWETVSEGSPMSPVFGSADELAAWMADPERGSDWMPEEAARRFVEVGWAPTGVSTPETGFVSGAEFVGWHETEEASDA